MNLYEEFKNAAGQPTCNKFYALGKVVGIGKNDYGHKRFVLFIRETGSGGRFSPLLRMIRQAEFYDLAKHLNEHKDEFSAPAAKMAGRLFNWCERFRTRGNIDDGTYLSIEYGDGFLPQDTRLNDMVEVVGHVSGYYYPKTEWEDGGYIFQLIADKIEYAEPVISKLFGKEAGGFSTERPTSMVVLKGEVTRKTEKEGVSSGRPTVFYRLMIRTDNSPSSRHPNNIWTQYSSSMRVNDVGKLVKEGMKVGLCGTLTSTRKRADQKNGEPQAAAPKDEKDWKHYMNIQIDDMFILDEGTPSAVRGRASAFGDFGEEGTAPPKRRE